MLSKRIEALKEKALLRGKEGYPTHFDYDYNYALLSIYQEEPLYRRLAKSMAYAINNQDVIVYEDDTIGGRIYYNNERKVTNLIDTFDYNKEALNRCKNEIDNYDELRRNQLISENAKGHITWRFDYILKYGVKGLKEKYTNAYNNTNDIKAKEFYEGVIILLDSLISFNNKHIEYYKKIGNDDLVERMKKVPYYPAESFLEAVQSFYMQHIVVMRENPYGGNGPGRLDYYLWPYLKKDLEKGVITLSEVKEIIDELFLRFEERLYNMDMWVEAIVAGGTDENGESSVNPLTYIMIESIIDLNIIHPAIYIRLPKNPDDKLLSLCARYMMSGNNRAQILNDPSIIKSLTSNGVPYKEAVHYACGGCMEIGIQGKQSDFLYVGWQNVSKMLELMITGGISLTDNKIIKGFNAKKGLLNYDNFIDFYNDFILEAKRLTNISLKQHDIYSEVIENKRPAYLISSMIDDCLIRGRNMHAGGAKYHDYGATHLCLPNVIDALYAIKYAIFDEKICDKIELLNVIKNNFIGYENLQYKLKNIPKYGEDNDEVDEFAKMVMEDFSNMYLNYKTRHNGKGKPVQLTFIFSPAAASILGATPDGRNAHSQVAYGITPHLTSMKKGITSAINSCCKMPYYSFYGGASSMWDFDNSWINEDIIKALIKTFIEKNGQIFQGNTTSVIDLIKAKTNPEQYENLFVRVGGYSAKFTNLWPELQDEVINRFRHSK